MPQRVWITALALLCALAASVAPGLGQGDSTRGKEVFGLRCITCHAVACNRVAPLLRDIFGRKAAAVADYPYYSEPLKNSGIVWSESLLDKMMIAPEKFLPGWAMDAAYLGKVEDAQQRQDVIAFLKAGDTSLDLCPR